jgi:hypothetical protein
VRLEGLGKFAVLPQYQFSWESVQRSLAVRCGSTDRHTQRLAKATTFLSVMLQKRKKVPIGDAAKLNFHRGIFFLSTYSG